MLGPDGACRGHCRERQEQLKSPTSTRVKVPPDCHIRFADQLQGWQETHLGDDAPDFIVKRKDGLDAYQLAVVVDDAWQGITHIVRGCDLMDSTPRQIFLQQLLGHSIPTYSHIPVITDNNGQKFSKQNHAPALIDEDAAANLRAALRFLQQDQPPTALRDVAQILDFAICHWAPAKVPRLLSMPSNMSG
jgi:glutamyl-Q tRNA(Asp) synthetase